MGNVSNVLKKHEGLPESAPLPAAAATAATAEPAVKPVIREPAVERPLAPAAPLARAHYSHALVAHHDRAGVITEQYRSMRARILARFPGGKACLMITSAEGGEGKTVTCLNLGFVLAARSEARVAIVDCDLRKKKVASLVHEKNGLGLADVLRGTRRLQEVIKPTLYPNLFIIPAGQARREEAAELVNRPELEDVTRELRRQYDYILIDTPPLNVMSDASIVGHCVDEAILIVRMNRTRREAVDMAIQSLEAVNVKLTGLVLTHHKQQPQANLYS